MSPFQCTNTKCLNHVNPIGRWYKSKGFYTTKHNQKYVQRYQCKTCHTKFSDNSFLDTYRQHKPEVNEQVFNWYSSGATLRRMAKNIKITRRTAVRKFRFLADKARMIHACELISGNLACGEVQFDEQETFLLTKEIPLSIAIAVDGNHTKLCGKIIDVEVAMMPARGRNARESQTGFLD